MRLVPVLAILCIVVSTEVSHAQVPGGLNRGNQGMVMPVFGGAMMGGFGGGGFGGGWGGWGGGFSSTAGEGFQRGMADVIRSAGAAELMNSAAAQNYEEARSRYLDNVLKHTQTYFENRKMAKAYREELKGPPVSREALYRMAKSAAPKRLSPGEYDPVTGDLVFPVVLQDPAFADSVKRLQELFKTRNETGGGLGLKAYIEIDNTARTLQEQLQARIKDFPPGDYVQARDFLRSLSHEARFAAG